MQNQKQPLVSVIIPCYNQAHFLRESVESILDQTFQDWEIIIVNDGSPDNTHDVAQEIIDANPQHLIKLIDQENTGLAGARNSGINNASGKYIIPLDSDDKFAATYLEKGTAILESNPSIGIVYCIAEFFGIQKGIWQLPPYTFPDILVDNHIFCSAFFHKSDWEQVGGYRSDMRYGWEDFEFWLSLIELQREVFRIPEVLFFYRQHQQSMADSITPNQYMYLYQKLYFHHAKLYDNNIEVFFKKIVEKNYINKLLLSQVQNLETSLALLASQKVNFAAPQILKFSLVNLAVFFNFDTEQDIKSQVLEIFKLIFSAKYSNYTSLTIDISYLQENQLNLDLDANLNEFQEIIETTMMYLDLEEGISIPPKLKINVVNLSDPLIWENVYENLDGYITFTDHISYDLKNIKRYKTNLDLQELNHRLKAYLND